MLIVGGGAALTAIAAYLAFIGLKSLRAAWRARAAERRAAQHAERRYEAPHEFYPAPGE
jgi:threonine/homoserine/homoserine lactone efflux protein